MALATCPLLSAATPALAQRASDYVYAVDLDIVPAERDKFVEAIKENATATVKEPGCRQFDVGPCLFPLLPLW